MGNRSDALFSSILSDVGPWVNRVENIGLEPLDPELYRAECSAALLRSIVKKFQDEIDQEAANANARNLFERMNLRCSAWHFHNPTWIDEYIVGEVKSELYNFFYPNGEPLFSEAEIWRKSDVGPGVAVGATGESFLEKAGLSKLTATSEWLYDSYVSSFERSSLWVDAEISRILHHGRLDVIRGSVLSFAPKTTEVSRVIQPQPSLNMMFQKGMSSLIEQRLKAVYGIDLRIQPRINSELARRGSVDGIYGTIDLKSASDTIAYELVEELLPRQVLAWFNISRIPCYRVKGGEDQELHMLGTMGNGWTFSFQTLLFAAIVTAVYRIFDVKLERPVVHGRKPVTWLEDEDLTVIKHGNFAVFGDDIIVRRDMYDHVTRVLGVLGFIVNDDKSFNTGHFRESCGTDWFNGVNIRGVYCKTLASDQDVLSLTNRLIDWSCRHFIPLPSTLKFLSGILKRSPPLVPHFDDDSAGLKVPLQAFGPEPEAPDLFSYKRYVPRVKRLDLMDESLQKNSSMILIAAIKGSLRGGSLTKRLWKVSYRYRRGIVPCWEHVRLAPHLFNAVGNLIWYESVGLVRQR